MSFELIREREDEREGPKPCQCDEVTKKPKEEKKRTVEKKECRLRERVKKMKDETEGALDAPDAVGENLIAQKESRV